MVSEVLVKKASESLPAEPVRYVSEQRRGGRKAGMEGARCEFTPTASIDHIETYLKITD